MTSWNELPANVISAASLAKIQRCSDYLWLFRCSVTSAKEVTFASGFVCLSVCH